MQNPSVKSSRMRQHLWSWASLNRTTNDDKTEESSLSLDEWIALTSDQSIRAQRDYGIDTTGSSSGGPRG